MKRLAIGPGYSSSVDDLVDGRELPELVVS